MFKDITNAHGQEKKEKNKQRPRQCDEQLATVAL
jgi:hypothetical protein